MSKQLFVVIRTGQVNGENKDFVVAICELKATADRLAQQDRTSFVLAVDSEEKDGFFWAPCSPVPPTQADKITQQYTDQLQAVEAKARRAGLTTEEIDTLKGKYTP